MGCHVITANCQEYDTLGIMFFQTADIVVDWSNSRPPAYFPTVQPLGTAAAKKLGRHVYGKRAHSTTDWMGDS